MMSLNGWQLIALEREQREQLRLQQVRSQARALLVACERETTALNDPAVQQLAAGGLRQVRVELERASNEIEQKPDRALKEIRAAQKQLHRVIADAEAAAQQWTRQQAESRARIAEVRARVEAETQTANKAAGEQVARARNEIAQAASLHQAGRYAEAIAACEEAEDTLQHAAEAALHETTRRAVVHGLVSTLKGMGFVVEGPQIRHGDSQGGIVTLVGQMPSGRWARFDVSIDGHLSFDFDGYAERSCGADLERIGQSLRKHFGVRLGPAQVTWKNPDRISKGARDLPSGGNQHIGCR